MIPTGARDLKIDEHTGDLVMGADGDFEWVTGIDAIEQDIRLALSLFQGEWFLDITAGIPYHQQILGKKPPPLLAIREIFRKQLLAVPGVAEILSLEVGFNNRTRETSVTWRVSTDEGELTGVQTI